MKYKLININTKEEHLCDKVIIDGFDYYVCDETLKVGDNEIFGNTSLKYGWNWGIKKIEDKKQLENEFQLIELTKSTREKYPSLMFKKKVIATSNPNIDIPKIVDEVERLAFVYTKTSQAHRRGFIDGYYKRQETHPFSEEDMIEFSEWTKSNGKATKELLQLWKEQRIKTIYYEN